MATVAIEDLIRDKTHRAHDELWELSERPFDDPAREAEQLRRLAQGLEALAVVCELVAMHEEGGGLMAARLEMTAAAGRLPY